jgi:hypothetical protein
MPYEKLKQKVRNPKTGTIYEYKSPGGKLITAKQKIAMEDFERNVKAKSYVLSMKQPKKPSKKTGDQKRTISPLTKMKMVLSKYLGKEKVKKLAEQGDAKIKAAYKKYKIEQIKSE